MGTSKKREEFNLDEALSAVESGEGGQLLKGVAEQIEPRAEFARQLEARLADRQADDDMVLGKVSSVIKSEQPLLTLMQAPRPTHPLRHQSDRPRLFTRASRAASVVISMAGVAAVLLAFVFMASMFQVRKEANEAGNTPTAVSGSVVIQDTLKLVPAFEQLFSLDTGFISELQLRWSPDGQLLAVGGEAVQIWSRSTGQQLHR